MDSLCFWHVSGNCLFLRTVTLRYTDDAQDFYIRIGRFPMGTSLYLNFLSASWQLILDRLNHIKCFGAQNDF